LHDADLGDNEDLGDTPPGQLKKTNEEEVDDPDGGSVRRMLEHMSPREILRE
jgi:hypothetical protein